MAHEIVGNQISYVGETPWHGLGTKVEEGSSPEHFLKMANLDWTVDPYPVFAEVGDEKFQIPNKQAFLRSSDRKVMTLASEAWRPLQNRDAVEFMKKYADAGKANLETVGALRDGEVLWALAKLNHSFETRPGDRTEGYVLITSPHVVGRSISVSSTTIRVVCANTLAMADKQGKVAYKQNHLAKFNVEAARASIEAAHEQLSEQERKMSQLDKLKLSIEDAAIKILIPTFAVEMMDLELDEQMAILTNPTKMPKVLANIINSIYDAPGAISDTAYGILNGVTHYCDHVAGASQDTRMYNSMVGGNRGKKIEVEKLLLELAA